MKSQLKLLKKYQILNFIKILLSGIKSLIKHLFKLVIHMLIINFLICIAVTFCNKKWDIIINLFLDNIFSIWDHLPGWENLKNLFSHNNTNNKFKTEVPYDLKAELKRVWLVLSRLCLRIKNFYYVLVWVRLVDCYLNDCLIKLLY